MLFNNLTIVIFIFILWKLSVDDLRTNYVMIKDVGLAVGSTAVYLWEYYKQSFLEILYNCISWQLIDLPQIILMFLILVLGYFYIAYFILKRLPILSIADFVLFILCISFLTHLKSDNNSETIFFFIFYWCVFSMLLTMEKTKYHNEFPCIPPMFLSFCLCIILHCTNIFISKITLLHSTIYCTINNKHNWYFIIKNSLTSVNRLLVLYVQ